MKSEVYKRRMDARNEMLAGIVDAAAREDQLERTTRNLHTRGAKCVEVGGGIFEHLFCSVTNFSFLCNKVVF
jgi:hypothetical protein